MYDPKCLELAEYFLSDRKKTPLVLEMTPLLAQHIQDAVEDWMRAVDEQVRQEIIRRRQYQ